MQPNDAVLTVTADWDTTDLTNNGQTVNASDLRIVINGGTTNDLDDVIGGGIFPDSYVEAFVIENDGTGDPLPIFPGRLVIKTPNGDLTITNVSPAGVNAPDCTEVLYQGPATNNQPVNVTNGVIDLEVIVDYNHNIQSVELSLYKHHTFSCFWGSDEIYQITML